MDSGIIKYSSIKTLICIEYPGVIVNHEKALQTLGGLESLTEIHKSEDATVELRYRPDDIYGKAAFGTRYPTNSALLKVKQKRNKITGEKKLFVELIGFVKTTYKFNTMMDYQYLTMERTENGYRSLYGISTVESVDIPNDWLNQPAPLHPVPPIFAPFSIPYAYNFRDEEVKAATNAKATLEPGALFATARKKRTNFNQLINFEDPIPTECRVKMDPLPTEYMREKLKLVQELFSGRPIWSRAALCACTKLNMNRLKVLLPRVAYNSISGPWRTMWVRFGYDPKTSTEAKIYQMLDFRYRNRDRTDTNPVQHKRSYASYKPAFNKAKPKIVQSDQLEHLTGDKSSSQAADEEKVHYELREGDIPTFRQTFYQLCDIHIPEVQALVHANDGKEPSCDKVHGFLAPDTMEKLRAVITKSVNKTIRERGNEADSNVEEMEEGSQTDQSDDEEDTQEEPMDEDSQYYESVLATYR